MLVYQRVLTKYCKGTDRSENLNGGVAQLGEHLPCKQGVRSSILLISTISNSLTHLIHFFSALRINIRGSVEEDALCTQICLNTSEKTDDTEEKHILVVP